MAISELMEKTLGIDVGYIDNIAKRNDLYTKYFIKKKNGGKREILQPSKELKVLQRWIVEHVVLKFPISDCSMAYSRGDSVKKNAEVHKRANYILHMDIKNFFPSITDETVRVLFERNDKIVKELKLSKEDIKLITDICLYRGHHLVIGSPASPHIANRIMYDFDCEMKCVASKMGIVYTRYADDLIFSSKKFIKNEFIVFVEELIIKNGFKVNKDKTFFMNKKGKRYITGVVLDNNTDKLGIGNKKYKELKRRIYNYLIKEEGDISYIQGYLSYVREINEDQYSQIKDIYQRYDSSHVLF